MELGVKTEEAMNEIKSTNGSLTLLLAKKMVLVITTLIIAAPLSIQTQHALAQEADAPSNEVDENLAKDASTEINVKNADIAAIVRIFSKKTKRNYILDENVRGKVTIYLPGKVSSDEAIRILDTVLQLKGFTSVPVGENLWKIIQAKDAKQTTVPLITGDRDGVASAAVVTRLINLKYVKAEDLQQLFAQLISPSGLVNAYPGTNSLLMIDAEDNIERLFRIVQSLDVPFSNREMTIIPIKHADALDLATKLNEIMGVGNGQNGGSDTRASLGRNAAIPPPAVPQQIAGSTGTNSLTAATQNIGGRGLEPKIIPDERTNSIIVVADEDMTARIRALVSELDSTVDLSGNQFFVYRCQHANAEDLAQVLSGLMGGGGGTGGGTGTSRNSGFGGNNLGGGGLGGGLSGSGALGGTNSGFGGLGASNNGGSSFTSGSNSGNRGQGAGSRRGGGQNQRGTVTAQVGENISITADPATNSLVINASKSDYEKIKALLRQLDIKRRQVLVEAMLLEVAVEDTATYSAEFLASGGGDDGGAVVKSDFGNLGKLFTDPNAISGFSVAAASAGTLTLPGNIQIPTQSILLTAAQSNRNINVLSAPTILATDNEEAEIIVGQNVPFLASTSTNQTNLNNTFNQVDRQDVGIKLRLTPQISSRDYVTLNLFTEVSDVLSNSDQLGPTTTVRTSQTTVIAKNGQMIVTGGLMSDDNQNTAAGVPFMQDIPVLGHLFKRSGDRGIKRNLLIFISPKILKDQFDARDATIVRRSTMKEVIAQSHHASLDRHDILDSPAIDSVSEATLSDAPKPGTIRPPKQEVKDIELPPLAEVEVETDQEVNIQKNNRRSLQKLPDQVVTQEELEPARVIAPAAPAVAEQQEDQLIDLEVAPKLPDQISRRMKPDATETVTFRQEAPAMARMAPEKLASQSRYIVFTINAKDDIPVSIPFSIDPDRLTFGILVSDSPTTPFFRLGQVYTYSIAGKKIELKPLGIFSSGTDAANRYPEIGNKWHALSPHETMNLGNGPWRIK
jgi:general secretion pathway protein D